MCRRRRLIACVVRIGPIGRFDNAQTSVASPLTGVIPPNGNRAPSGGLWHRLLGGAQANVAISEYRRRRLPPGEQRRGYEAEPVDRTEPLHENLLRIERAAQVQQALDRLSDEHRAILVLREIDNCDYDEIARILDLPVGTVRSRLHRARLQLREQLVLVMGENGERR
jgi:hypothetical protein